MPGRGKELNCVPGPPAGINSSCRENGFVYCRVLHQKRRMKGLIDVNIRSEEGSQPARIYIALIFI